MDTSATNQDTSEADQPPGTDGKPPCTIFLFNMSEDVWPFISALDDEQAKAAEIAENVALSDRDYVGLRAQIHGPLTFVSPAAFDPDFVDYIGKLTHESFQQVVVTSSHSGKICEDILIDKDILDRLADGKSVIDVLSYCASKSLYGVVGALRSRGLRVELPEAPETALTLPVAMEAGSKTGIRRMLLSHPELQLPMVEGVCGEGLNWIVNTAAAYLQTSGVVIKTNKGHAGMGVVIIRPGELDNTSNQKQAIRDRLLVADGYWDKFPAVVERFVPTDVTIGGGFPNIEGRVNPDGSIELLYFCGMRVLPNGIFAGVEINKMVLPEKTIQELKRIGHTLGTYYAQAGYRGYFDVDCLAGMDGVIYVSESNMRHTGGTYAYQVAKRLFGADFMERKYIATQMVSIPQLPSSFKKVAEMLDPLLYKPGKEEGIIIVSSNLIKLHKLTYMVVGKDQAEALRLEEQMFTLLQQNVSKNQKSEANNFQYLTLEESR